LEDRFFEASHAFSLIQNPKIMQMTAGKKAEKVPDFKMIKPVEEFQQDSKL